MVEKNSQKSMPAHIGIIMDGNRRWAYERNLPTFDGHLRGYEKLFLIDALVSGKNDPGELEKVPSGEGTRHLFSSHGLDFFDLLELGKNLGLQMPEVAGIYGIEIENPVSFGEKLSPPLLEKLPGLIQAIAEDIRSSLNV